MHILFWLIFTFSFIVIYFNFVHSMLFCIYSMMYHSN
uniref:Uncharacterized protein n=1 Tax=Anguilla anguilla TaxID=7936 RepID=A0A0E9R4L5_ANGAN